MRNYGKAHVKVGVFLTSAVDGKKWSPPRPGCNHLFKSCMTGYPAGNRNKNIRTAKLERYPMA
jgi:hypothetical protein